MSRYNKTDMPIHTCSRSPFGVDALWTYVPGEEVDFKKYWYIRHLRIECYKSKPDDLTVDDCDIGHNQDYTRCSGCCSLDDTTDVAEPTQPTQPYTLPSLKYLFPRLESLIIKNVMACTAESHEVFIGLLTNIPTSVISLEIEYSLIQNIGEIVMDSPNLLYLQLRSNRFPNHITRLPPNLLRFSTFRETFTNTIQANTLLEYVFIIHSNIPSITNLHTNHVKDIMIRAGTHPYDHLILNSTYNPITILKHIALVNAQLVYLHYGSLPTHTHHNNNNNPIIVALHLASNYPRRFAEFMAYP